ncbi:hypothetical protein RDI58_000844 [Solanum bulbocastanum]|uniref:Uncharacterized protein n=1 Tax=Solanum bulbocastanum TaxID=147425 RepID=A0AAN8UAW1_SOLBU
MGGRKELADLTNSTKSSSVRESKLRQSTKKGHVHELFSQGSWISSWYNQHRYLIKPCSKNILLIQFSFVINISPRKLNKALYPSGKVARTDLYDQVRCLSFSLCAASPKLVKPRYISWLDDSVLDFSLICNTYPFKALMGTTFN